MEEEIFDKVLDCGLKLRQKIVTLTIKGNFERALVFYLDGVTRTLKAIKLLYDSEFFEECSSLVRILLESVIDLDYMSHNKEDRAKQFFEFDMLKTNEVTDLLQDLNAPLTSQDRHKIEFKFKNKTRWSQISVERMLDEIYGADKKIKDSHLLFYRHCCRFSHPSALTLGAGVFFDDKEYPIRKAYKTNLKETLPSLSCQLVLKIYHTVDGSLSLGYFAQIDQINAELARAVRSMEKKDKLSLL